jgi:Fic family protein
MPLPPNRFRRDRPYNELPDLSFSPAIETPPVHKAIIRASRSLAELKGRTGTLPNPDILLNTVALQEAKASSEIENIFTTHDELYRGLSLDALGLTPHAKEVLHYREALWQGAEMLKTRPVFSTNLFIDLGGCIKETTGHIRVQPGTKIVNPATGEVVYTPPEGEEIIRGKLAALERFCHEAEELDPLTRMAMMHYQFEAIHPFYDGNGRTGRVLLILYLLFSGLLELPVLFVSKFIIERKNQYYQLLRGVTERGEWEPWLLYMLGAVDETARATAAKIRAIAQLLAETLEIARTALPKPTAAKDLTELIFRQPYCKIRFVEEAGIAKRLTAASYLRQLESAGVLWSRKIGSEIFFINHRLFQLLTSELPPR